MRLAILIEHKCYGALLNEYCRFYDKRLGQSTTLTGRCITKFMNGTINELITGVFDHNGDAIVYGDTDSGYFSAYEALKEDTSIQWAKDSMIELADTIAEETNSRFLDFMVENFNIKPENNCIKAGRELVGTQALFVKRKRYAILYYDKEGKRTDKGDKPGELKAMGLDLKRSDTPTHVQNFLERILFKVLEGVDEDEVIEMIKEFKEEFRLMLPWQKGTPKRVNGLSSYTDKLNASKDTNELMRLQSKLLVTTSEKEARIIRSAIETMKKVTIPGHVMASINYNKLRAMYNDTISMPIIDGSKIIVCKLKPNALHINSIAYPIDEANLPEWFKKLPFDDEDMEATIVDKKVANLLGVLDWDLERAKNNTTFDNLFSL